MTAGALSRVAGLATALAVSACGDGSFESSISGVVRMDAQLVGEVQVIRLFAFNGYRTDSIVLTCPDLLDGTFVPGDPILAQIGSAEFTFSGSERNLVLRNVKSGGGRLVFASAHNRADSTIAVGCQADVSVRGGSDAQIDLTLFRVR